MIKARRPTQFALSVFLAGIQFMTSCTKQENLSPPSNKSLSQAPGLVTRAAAGLTPPTVNLIQSANVSAFAGDGRPGDVDGAPAFAEFNYPAQLTIDASGTVYTADQYNHVIRKIARDGTVGTLAGTGDQGFSNGINGFATFRYPYSVAVDAAGNVYVSDEYNFAIRKITPAGTTTTFAGNGVQGFRDNADPGQAEFGLPAAMTIDNAGNLYVADILNKALRKITPAGVVSTLAVDTTFKVASGLSVDNGGTIYVAANGLLKIRKVSPTGVISDVAGNGASGYRDGPAGFAEFKTASDVKVDGSGNIYVVDGGNGVIRKITPAGQVSTVAGPQSSGIFGFPFGVAIDPAGNFVVADGLIGKFFKITMTTPALVGTVTGTGTQGFVNGIAGNTEFFNPAGIVIDPASRNIYIVDENNNAIRVISPLGQSTTLAGGTKGFADGKGALAKFNAPTGIAIDGSGNLYVADANNHRIRLVTPDGTVTTLAGRSTRGFADGADSVAEFNFPFGVALDAAGTVYVADADNNRIRKISGGQVSTLAGNGLSGFADGGPAAAEFRAPTGVAVDASGNVYVADQGNNRIREISPSGVVKTLAGSTNGYLDGTGAAARFNQPVGLVVDGSGIVYVTDQHNNRIRKITAAGVVTTLAGNGTAGFLDAQLGLNAEFNLPFGIAISPSGSLYINDWQNNVIREIQ